MLWDCNGGANQRWASTSTGELRVYDTFCLDAPGGGSGSPAVIAACTGSGSQKWAFHADGTITGTPSGLCLDAAGQATGNGTKIQVWNCTGGDNQRWGIRN